MYTYFFITIMIMIIITIIITITITIIDKYTYIKIITIRRVGLVGPKNNE